MASIPEGPCPFIMESTLYDMVNRVSILESAIKNQHGGIPMNQEDLMNQLLGTIGAAGSSPLGYDDVQKMKEMMEDATRYTRTETGAIIDAPMWGGNSDAVSRTPPGELSFPGTSGDAATVSSVLGSGPGVNRVGADAGMIDTIIAIRNKLDDFLDGSNVLIKVMNPQTIREMVREMRHEIRELKRDHGISELAIIKHLEKELEVEADSQAEWRTETYEANDVPF